MAMRRAWRYGLLAVGGVVVLVVAAGAIAAASFDPNSLKPRIEAAVQQATGRTLALNGPIRLKWSLWPTVALQDVALANPPGFSRPQMATLQRLDVQLAVLPLLHREVEIDRLVLVHPDIRLETNPQGATNWQFTPANAATPSNPAPAQPKPGHSPGATDISVSDVTITDGTLALRDDRTGHTLTLALQSLAATAASADAPTRLKLQAAYNGLPFALNGDVGPLSRLQQPQSDTPWPVNLRLTSAAANISLNGSLTRPLEGRGYTLAIDGTVPDLSALAPVLPPGTRLPPLHDVHVATHVADSGGPVPHVNSATLHLGAADLGSYVGGLQLTSVDIDAPAQNQPVHVNAQVTLANTAVSLTASLGAAQNLLQPNPTAPLPIELILRAGNANLTLNGTLAHPETLSGAALVLNASVPDLSALSPLAHRPLPALTQVALQSNLSDAPGGFEHGAMLHDLKLTTAQGNLFGDLGLQLGPPPSLTGQLHSDRIDADALLAAAGKPVQAPPPVKAPPANALPAKPPAPQPAASKPVQAPPPPAPSNRLFSDTPLPFALLHQANADVALTVADLHSGGLDYRNLNLHAVLQAGRLRIDPMNADLPEGAATGTLSVDASAPAPPVALTLHAPGLEVAPLLAAAGLPGYASGRLEVYADLHSAGASPHAIAAGLDGTLGLAMQNGTIDTELLNRLLGPVLEKANLLGMLSRGGSSALHCFALRADAHNGVAELRTLVLNSSLLTMDGSGSINLRDETLDMALRPQGRVAGTGLVVPMTVTGPIRAPDAKVNAIGTFEANAGTVAGGVIGSATPLGLLGGLVSGGKLFGGGSADACAGPLALARGEAAPASAAAAPAPKSAGPGNLLRQLFR